VASLAGGLALALVGLTPAVGNAATSPDAVLVPDQSWTCGSPGGIVPPTRGQLVLTATLRIGATHDVGTTQYGHRRVRDVQGGTVQGRVGGQVLTGGLDLELTLPNGAVELEQVLVLRLADGAPVYLRTCGVAPAGDDVMRLVPDFEVANSSSSAWLNTGSFVGTRTVDPGGGTVTLAVYDVAGVTGGERVQLTDPAGVPDQPWDCLTPSGTRGAAVFTETVTLGSSISVGASKRGTRNIIPITGGRLSGRLSGSVLPGGADYQLLGSSARLDARYALATNDGEYILVRNCGPIGALVPAFETRADGPYAYLNANRYLSSDPGGASGGVSITFYDNGSAMTTTSSTTTTSTTTTSTTTSTTTRTATTSSAGCSATYALNSSWPGGYVASVVVTAGPSAIRGWKVTLTLPAGTSITNAWNATVWGSSGTATATNAAYNGSLPPGQSASFGFQGTGSGGGVAVSCSPS
jgi:hypothetical protein